MPAQADGDLMLCRAHGVAYQADRGHIVNYDEAYYSKCASYEGQAIAQRINAGRMRLVAEHFGAARAVDIGIGSGEFVRARPNTFGRDVNPVAMEWLKRCDLWAERLDEFGAFTFWDVLEHVPDPGVYLDRVRLHGYVFASLPIFASLDEIRASKHYRPGEHLQYFTADGFVAWMQAHGFLLLEQSDFETSAGREAIGSFAFTRNKYHRD